jgi:hypothetical protein
MLGFSLGSSTFSPAFLIPDYLPDNLRDLFSLCLQKAFFLSATRQPNGLKFSCRMLGSISGNACFDVQSFC